MKPMTFTKYGVNKLIKILQAPNTRVNYFIYFRSPKKGCRAKSRRERSNYDVR